jgi:hypothetical protein
MPPIRITRRALRSSLPGRSVLLCCSRRANGCRKGFPGPVGGRARGGQLGWGSSVLTAGAMGTGTRRNSMRCRMFLSSRYVAPASLVPKGGGGTLANARRQRNLNNAFAYDLVPSPTVITAALRAARRVNDFPTAVRVFEGKAAHPTTLPSLPPGYAQDKTNTAPQESKPRWRTNCSTRNTSRSSNPCGRSLA